MSYRYLEALAKRGIYARIARGVTPADDQIVLFPAKKANDKVRGIAEENREAILAEHAEWIREESAKAMERINATGFAFIKVPWLRDGGEIIILARDEAKQQELERRFHKVVYTLEEGARLKGLNPRQIKMVHSVKQTFGGRVEAAFDPRPDLADDSAPWENLLSIARESPLFGALHGFRCNGARLVRHGAGWMLKYEPGQEGFAGEWDFDAHYTLWFRGAEAELRRLLRSITVPDRIGASENVEMRGTA